MNKRLWLGLALTALAVIGATPAFFPSTSMRALLVDQNNVPYSIGTAGAAGSFFPSNQARVLLVDENNQPYKASSGGSGSVTSIATSNGLTGGTITTSGTISGINAAADGATKGVSTFTAADFNATTGIISLDYANGQKATAVVSGFLSATDWVTFNAKGSGTVTSIATTSPITGGTVTGTGTVACATCTTSAAALSLNQLIFGAGSQGMAVGDLTGDVTTSGGKATTLANTAVTPASYTNTNLTVDAKGRITAASNGTAATTPGLVLVEHKTVTSNSTTITFSSLDGNTDGEYRLVMKIKNTSGGTPFYKIAPNAATTNIHGEQIYGQGSTPASSAQTFLTLGFANANNTWFRASIDIDARKSAHSVAQPLTYSGTFSNWDGTNSFAGSIGGEWTETATNLTSLDVVSSVASGIGDGSEMWLYKYAQ